MLALSLLLFQGQSPGGLGPEAWEVLPAGTTMSTIIPLALTPSPTRPSSSLAWIDSPTGNAQVLVTQLLGHLGLAQAWPSTATALTKPSSSGSDGTPKRAASIPTLQSRAWFRAKETSVAWVRKNANILGCFCCATPNQEPESRGSPRILIAFVESTSGGYIKNTTTENELQCLMQHQPHDRRPRNDLPCLRLPIELYLTPPYPPELMPPPD